MYSYDELFLKWEMFREIWSENQNKHFMFKNIFPKIQPLWYNVEIYSTALQATDDNVAQYMRTACWVTKTTDTKSEYVILNVFRGKNGYASAHQYYVDTQIACFFF